MKPHEQHLQLLTIFHYIAGTISALFACFPVFHLVFGIFMLAAPEDVFDGSGGPPPNVRTLMGVMFTVIPVVIILGGWCMAGMILYAGRCLARRRHYTLCMIVAAIMCIFVPIGTALGVFSIVVLTRPEVKEEFDRARAPA